MLRPIATFLALVICVSPVVAQPPLEPPTPTIQESFIQESFYGDWVVKKCEHQGQVLRSGTSVVSMSIDRDSIVMLDSAKNEKELNYELFEGENGWAIDLYALFGAMRGKLMPSRIAVQNDKLTLLFPYNNDARDARPTSFSSVGQPNWVVFHFERDK